jgi:hypothetical protein
VVRFAPLLQSTHHDVVSPEIVQTSMIIHWYRPKPGMPMMMAVVVEERCVAVAIMMTMM